MKKVLFIITQSEMGGAQKYLLTLLEHLDRAKFLPMVAAAEKPGDIFQICEKLKVPFCKLQYLDREINIKKDFQTLSEIRQLLQREKPDVLHLLSSKAGFLGSLAGRLERIPRIVYRIGGWAFCEDIFFLKKWIYFLAEWISAFWKDVIIVNNKADFALAEKLHIGAKKLRYIPNGLSEETTFLSRIEARKKLGLSSGDFIIGTIANFYPNKNLMMFLRALSAFRAFHETEKSDFLWKAVIIGDGLERGNLERYIEKEKFSPKIFLAGQKPDASQFLKAFDVFVLSSKKEGMPWVILEAFAAEIPVVATKVGGIPFMMEDRKEGLLIESDNAEQLALALNTLIKNPELGISLAVQALKRVRAEFSLKNMLCDTEACYDTSCHGSTSSP